MSKFPTPARRRALGLLVLCSLVSWRAAAVDPFYENLLNEGKAAATRADWPRATLRFRLACFGLLEEPVRLAECLARLATAQAVAADREGFGVTVDRLLEVEQRFGAYAAARLDGGLRAELEASLERWGEPEKLLAVAVFADLGRRVIERRLAALPPAERRRDLEARLAAEPESQRWKLQLAALEIDDGQPAAAIEALSGLLESPVPRPEAVCLRGLARAALGVCAEAMSDLESCADPMVDPRTAEATLGCHVRLARWAEAEALLAALPEPQKQTAAIRRLSREVRKGTRTAARETPPAASEPPAEVLATAPAVVEPASPPPELPPELAAQLVAARQLLGRAAAANELESAFVSVRQIADANPALTEAQHLVAEIAYRTSRWAAVVEYFRRGGAIAPSRPELLFYLAVAQYETGDRQLAAETLRACQGRLKETAFVRSYVAKIHGGSP